MNSKDVGNLGEHIAIVELLNLGLEVSRPLGDNSRYDLIIDNEGLLLTCQIKSTASATPEYAEFWMTSSQAHRGRGRTGYNVDCFILVDINNRKVFLLPNTGKSSIKLRYGIRVNSASNMSEDFLLSKEKFDSLI